MSHSYRIQSLFSLPSMKAGQLQSVLTELVTIAQGEAQTPSPVPAELALLVQERDTLACTIMVREAVPTVLPGEVKSAVIDLRGAWRAFESWARGMMRVPEGPGVPTSDLRAMHATVFAEGNGWMVVPSREFWARSAGRLAAVKEREYEQAVTALGGEKLLGHVQELHARLGASLGVTRDNAVSALSPRDAMRKALIVVRLYVARIVGLMHDASTERTAQLERLLQPLSQIKSRRAKAHSVESTENTAATESTGGTAPVTGNTATVHVPSTSA